MEKPPKRPASKYKKYKGMLIHLLQAHMEKGNVGEQIAMDQMHFALWERRLVKRKDALE